MARVAAFAVRRHGVADADVGEGAAHHHFVVAAAGSIGVEVRHVHGLLLQVFAGRARRLNGAGGRDVVGRHGIAEQGENPRAFHFHRLRGVGADREERRLLDVGGVFPSVGVAGVHFDGAPGVWAGEHVRVLALEHGGRDLRDGFLDFRVGGPDVAQEHVGAVRVLPQGFALQVDARGAGDGVGDHQRRRREPVRAHFLMHPALEVAVAGEHRGNDQIAARDRLGNRLWQRPGVADAGRAAVADEVEAHLIQRVLQAGRLQVLGDDLGAGREGGLHPRLGAKTLRQRFLGHQAGAKHHGGIGGIGTRRDGGDHHVAIAQTVVGASHRHGLRLGALAAQRQRIVEGAAHVGDVHPILRAFGAGQGWPNGRQVQLQGRGIDGFHAGFAPHPLRLGVGFHQGHRLRWARGQFQVADRLGVHRKEAAGRAVFRRHVGNRGPVGEREAVQSIAAELHELAHHAVLAKHFHHAQHQVGGGHALGQRAVQLEADDFGNEHGNRLPEHRRFGLDAAHAPAEHAQPVHHRGVAVGAHQGVRVGGDAPVLLFRPNGAREVFQIHLVADAGAGRHHAEVVEGALPPAQEPIALLVALHLDGDVLLERLGIAEAVHHHRVVDHQIHRREGIDDARILARRHHRAAHGGEIGDAGHAGEILHQHPRRAIGDLLGRWLFLGPVRQGLDVLPLHRAAVLEAQQVLEQDLQRHRQPRHIAGAALGCFGKAEIGVLAATNAKGLAGAETVAAHGFLVTPPWPGLSHTPAARCDLLCHSEPGWASHSQPSGFSIIHPSSARSSRGPRLKRATCLICSNS